MIVTYVRAHPNTCSRECPEKPHLSTFVHRTQSLNVAGIDHGQAWISLRCLPCTH